MYDPLWAECEKLGLAVGFHEGTPCQLPVAIGERFDGVHEDLWMTEHVAAHPIEAMYACLSIIAGGVCERFPTLRFAFLEGNCSWLPFWLWRMDEHHELRERVVADKLPLPPSEYFVDPSRKSGGALHRLHCFCLEFDGACEVQRRVPTDWIIEPIDVSGYGSFSLAS